MKAGPRGLLPVEIPSILNICCEPIARCPVDFYAASLSFAKILEGHKSRPVTMLQTRPHAIHFKRILVFGEGQAEADAPSYWK